MSPPGGVLPVLYSYYGSDGSLDLDANARQIDYALETGADGVTLLGLASEGHFLTTVERYAAVRAAAKQVPHNRHLLVTVRLDDDASALSETVLNHRDGATFIVQVGVDASRALSQTRLLRARYPQIRSGLQLAPGLIVGATSTADLLREADVEIDVIKAEYNSVELSADMARLTKKPVLLVGKHGLNIIDYLRIGAAGVIPGIEMTAPLVKLLGLYRAGLEGDVYSAYGQYAPYVDFAMQDLATVIAVGRAVTGNALGLRDSRGRSDNGAPIAALDSAIAEWQRYWVDRLSPAS